LFLRKPLFAVAQGTAAAGELSGERALHGSQSFDFLLDEKHFRFGGISPELMRRHTALSGRNNCFDFRESEAALARVQDEGQAGLRFAIVLTPARDSSGWCKDTDSLVEAQRRGAHPGGVRELADRHRKKPVDLNCSSTVSVADMKSMLLFSILTATAGLVWWAMAQKPPALRQSPKKELPASCTLLAMSPDDRSLHLKRLESLRRAGRLQRIVPEGFVFQVDLREMPYEDLQLWMSDEQRCCSFLRMESNIRSDSLAEVTVVSPPELRSEVMQTFGFKNGVME
jgi:hypothetical protein